MLDGCAKGKVCASNRGFTSGVYVGSNYKRTATFFLKKILIHDLTTLPPMDLIKIFCAKTRLKGPTFCQKKFG